MWESLAHEPEPPKKSSSGFFSSLFGGRQRAEEVAELPRNNIYLHGTVGTGKSYLMDLFFDQVTNTPKKRVHFHDFMLDVHRRIHHWRLHERTSKDEDPIVPVADKLRREARLLCFDEFQVTDVADAMILKRLFEKMMERGMRFVITSNRLPTELYKNGLNRPLFVPFIDNVLMKRFQIIDLSSGNDYRMVGKKSSRRVYMFPFADPLVAQEFVGMFEELTKGQTPRTKEIAAFGARKITVPKCARGVCMYTFDQLVRTSYGASDYLAIAKKFHTVFLGQVPKMERDDCNLARRFITLIDVLYEHKCKLVVSAAVRPQDLFLSAVDYPETRTVNDGAAKMPEFTDSEWASLKKASSDGPDEIFAFQRSLSRLNEMQTEAYLQLAHKAASLSSSPHET